MDTGKCICRFAGIYAYCRYFIDRKWYILVLNHYIEKHATCLKDYKIRPFFRIRHAHGDLCKHLGIGSSTDLDVYTEYLKMIYFYSPLGMWHVFSI